MIAQLMRFVKGENKKSTEADQITAWRSLCMAPATERKALSLSLPHLLRDPQQIAQRILVEVIFISHRIYPLSLQSATPQTHKAAQTPAKAKAD